MCTPRKPTRVSPENPESSGVSHSFGVSHRGAMLSTRPQVYLLIDQAMTPSSYPLLLRYFTIAGTDLAVTFLSSAS